MHTDNLSVSIGVYLCASVFDLKTMILVIVLTYIRYNLIFPTNFNVFYVYLINNNLLIKILFKINTILLKYIFKNLFQRYTT
jgi:hypothetical protein